MLPRFYVPSIEPAHPDVLLPPEEARHLTRVLRLGVGDDVVLFDGRGSEFRGRIAHARHETVKVTIVERLTPAGEPAIPISIAQAVLKPDAMDDVVRDATMLGVARIDPLITSRVAVKEHLITSGRAIERWRRVAIASAKQCRRATLPVVSAPLSLDEWLRSQVDVGWRILFVEPAALGSGEGSLRSLEGQPRPPSAALMIGPEGGWSADEVRRAADAGCRPVSLGALTLRADAVPVAAIALVRFVLDDL